MNAWRCLASIMALDAGRFDAWSRPAGSSLIVC
jgi:hypothetical protein